MIVATTENINNKPYEILGIVQGSTVQTKDMFTDIASSFKSLLGGEITGYTDMMNHAREEAFRRMIENAEGIYADAIIGFRYTTSAIMGGASEILAYGTAIKFIE